MPERRRPELKASPGRFITFEGGEGTGKTTQLRLLARSLRVLGLDVVETREPGGTEGAERIRDLLIEGAVDRWSATAELLMMVAARVDHVERVIAPALARDAWVLCDRYVDSTRVYQGIAGGLGIEMVDALHRLVLPGPVPDLTLLLDLTVHDALMRRRIAGSAGRFEAKGELFHESVREGFLAIARREPDRVAIVNAALPEQDVEDAVLAVVEDRLAG